MGGAKEQRKRDRNMKIKEEILLTPGRDTLPLSGTMATSNNKVEEAVDDTPVVEVILPLKKGVGYDGAVKVVPPSRDDMTCEMTPSTTQRQTSIANYFASVRGGPLTLSVAQPGQAGSGIVSDTVKKFRKIENGRQTPERRETPDPSSGSITNQTVKTEVMKLTFDKGCAKVSTRVKQD